MKCPFCHPEKDREIIAASELAFAIYDKFPVNRGHALIIPKRHCADYFELTVQEQTACILLLNEVKEFISHEFFPNGFNVGINIGSAAGQTVNHAHIHLIPRHNGDVDDPRGGIRGVIPDRQKY